VNLRSPAPSAGNSPRLLSGRTETSPSDKSPVAQVYPSDRSPSCAGGIPTEESSSTTSLSTAVSYTSSNFTDDGAAGITLTPSSGSVSGFCSSNLAVHRTSPVLGPGVWQGLHHALRFGYGSVRVCLMWRSCCVSRSSPAGSPKEHLAAGCTPSKLVPLFRRRSEAASACPRRGPAPGYGCLSRLRIRSQPSRFVTTFSTGGPPLSLTALREGIGAAPGRLAV